MSSRAGDSGLRSTGLERELTGPFEGVPFGANYKHRVLIYEHYNSGTEVVQK